MIRFIRKTYINNIFFHLCVIFILILTMLSSGTLICRMQSQAADYSLISGLSKDKSILVGGMPYEEYVKLTGSEKVTNGIQKIYVFDESQKLVDPVNRKITEVFIYPDEFLEKMDIRISKGKKIGKNAKSGEAQVYISENGFNINAGDTREIYTVDYEGNIICSEKIHIAGVLAEGQKLYGIGGEYRPDELSYKDMFSPYRYEQSRKALMIVPRSQAVKFSEEFLKDSYVLYTILSYEGLSDEEFENFVSELQMKSDEERMLLGIENLKELSFNERNLIIYKAEIGKNVPLAAIIFIMLSVCLIAIIMIKINNSMRLYGVAYIIGMKKRLAPLHFSMEIFADSVFSLCIFYGFSKLQEKFTFIETINLQINAKLMIVMMMFVFVITCVSYLISRVTYRNGSPVDLLKNMHK